MSAFAHVADLTLRKILESEPDPCTIRQAFRLSAEALGHDIIDDCVPASALDFRIEMGREARDAIADRDWPKAHSALRNLWLA